MDLRTPWFQIFNQDRLGRGVERGLKELAAKKVIPRIQSRDWTVWKKEDKEISNRLGWLRSAEAAAGSVEALEMFAAEVRHDQISHVLLLGMGGSSLAPDLFGRVFKTPSGYPALRVLDTTAPETIREADADLSPERTIVVTSSKSGTTAELLALFCYFFDKARHRLGPEAGRHFVAITDPGTPLESLARTCGFRRVFHGDPDIGGRFSALSAFGLVPAALKGIDLRRLAASASEAEAACREEDPLANPAALLGTIMGAETLAGRDKLTLLVSPKVWPLAAWLEQLLAESTGKEGKGIVPVPEDGLQGPELYGEDRLFVQIQTADHPGCQPEVLDLLARGVPFIRFVLTDPYALAAQFHLWEAATAVAGHFLEINPFDQPDVESAKQRTRDLLGNGEEEAQAEPEAPVLVSDGFRIYGEGHPLSAAEALRNFLGAARKGDYVAVQAFLDPSTEVQALLAEFVKRLRARGPVPVTWGFGPRYLHSTGQLHKGGGNRGHFIQFAAAAAGRDLPIPDIPEVRRPAPTFGRLIAAQGWGDWLALKGRGRRVIRFQIEGAVDDGIREIISLLG